MLTRTDDSYPAPTTTVVEESSSNRTSSYPPSSNETEKVVGAFPVFSILTNAESCSYGVMSID